MTQTLAPVRPARLIIDGAAVDAASGRTFDTINPATEQVITQVAEAGPEDVDRAVQAARKAIDCLRSAGDDLASANLVINDQNSVLAQTDEVLIDLLKGGQMVLNIVLPLGGLVSELDSAITKLGLPSEPGGTAEATPARAPQSPPQPVAEAN